MICAVDQRCQSLKGDDGFRLAARGLAQPEIPQRNRIDIIQSQRTGTVLDRQLELSIVPVQHAKQGECGRREWIGVEHPAHYRLMFGADLAAKERHPTLQEASDASFTVLTSTLERGQAALAIRPGSVREQALAAWSLVHGLTILWIDQRLSFLGISGSEAERYARAATVAMCEGLNNNTPGAPT